MQKLRKLLPDFIKLGYKVRSDGGKGSEIANNSVMPRYAGKKNDPLDGRH